MTADMDNLINSYVGWIKERTSFRSIDDWVEITTPFLDIHNDHIQIYVQETKDGYLLTDDGYTISDLEISGCVLNTPKRKALLEVNINGFGVNLNGKAIEVFADEYIERWAKPNKKTWEEDQRILNRYVVPYIGGLKIGNVTRRHVIAVEYAG